MKNYEQFDKKKTCANAKMFLKDYHDWQLENQRFKGWLKSPDLTSTKVDVTSKNTMEDRLVDSANAEYECALRSKTLDVLAAISPQDAYYADLLRFRLINRWSVKKVCEELASN